jgi:hypothetical protein
MIEVTQDELALRLPGPVVDLLNVERLVAVLRTHGGWLKAHEIARALGEPISDSAERRVRRLASAAAPEVVSFPGSPGYKVWSACSVEEINHCIESLEAQAKDMIRRAHVYRLAYHRRHRGARVAEATAEGGLL